jgi:HSP20 family molecular chaperone IbpA
MLAWLLARIPPLTVETILSTREGTKPMFEMASAPCPDDAELWSPIGRMPLDPRLTFMEFLHCYRIIAQIPGLCREDISLDLARGVLVMTGERGLAASEDRDDGQEDGPVGYHIGLPDDADTTKIRAAFVDDSVIVTIGRRLQ